MPVGKINCFKKKLSIPWWVWTCLSISPVALILLIRYLLPRYVYKNITRDTVWSGKIILTKPVYVTNNATLIIKPNTLIICKDESALIICKDGKLTAEGKQNKAIVFSPEDFSHTVWYGIKILGTINNDTTANGTFDELEIDGVIYKASVHNYKSVIAKTPNAFKQGNDDCIGRKSNSLKFVKVLNAGANQDYADDTQPLTNIFTANSTSAVSAYQAEGTMSNTYVPNSQFVGVFLSDGTFSLEKSVVINSGNYSIFTRTSWGGTIDTVLATSGNETDLLIEAGTSPSNYSEIVYNSGSGIDISSSQVDLSDITADIKPALSMRRS